MQSSTGHSHVSPTPTLQHRVRSAIGIGTLLTLLAAAAVGLCGSVALPSAAYDILIAAAALAVVAVGVARLTGRSRLPVVAITPEQLSSANPAQHNAAADCRCSAVSLPAPGFNCTAHPRAAGSAACAHP